MSTAGPNWSFVPAPGAARAVADTGDLEAWIAAKEHARVRIALANESGLLARERLALVEHDDGCGLLGTGLLWYRRD